MIFSAFKIKRLSPAINDAHVWSASYTLQEADLIDLNYNARITVFDLAGNQKTTTDGTNFIFGEPVDYPLTLKPGWNLISIPVKSISTVDTLFQDHPTGKIWNWNLNEFEILESSSILRPKIGFWFYAQNHGSILVPGTPIINGEIILQFSWNLIGPTTLPPFDGKITEFDTVLIPQDHFQRPIWAWVETRYKAASHLEIGKGYWVYLEDP